MSSTGDACDTNSSTSIELTWYFDADGDDFAGSTSATLAYTAPTNTMPLLMTVMTTMNIFTPIIKAFNRPVLVELSVLVLYNSKLSSDEEAVVSNVKVFDAYKLIFGKSTFISRDST